MTFGPVTLTPDDPRIKITQAPTWYVIAKCGKPVLVQETRESAENVLNGATIGSPIGEWEIVEVRRV